LGKANNLSKTLNGLSRDITLATEESREPGDPNKTAAYQQPKAICGDTSIQPFMATKK
jgi:hypothetical protein